MVGASTAKVPARPFLTPTVDLRADDHARHTLNSKPRKPRNPRSLSFHQRHLHKQKQKMAMKVIRETFGRMPDGREVLKFTFSNSHGLSAVATTYGATLISFKAPARAGKHAQMALTGALGRTPRHTQCASHVEDQNVIVPFSASPHHDSGIL